MPRCSLKEGLVKMVLTPAMRAYLMRRMSEKNYNLIKWKG